MKPALFLTPLLGLAACTPAAPDPRGVDRDETVLTVTGTGRAEATPDQALFTAGLSSIAADAQAASARNAETMNKITAALARLDIPRSEEHTSELQSLMRISTAVFCLKKNNRITTKVNRKKLT